MQNQRRVFLKVLAAAPLLACSSTTGSPAAFGEVSAGNVSATQVGLLSVAENAPAILARDNQGLYAMTITCPHQGCDVNPSGSTLECPCHGSRFDSNGNLLQGPANTGLVHYAVSVDAAGNITINGRAQVASDVRTPV
jgi:Rieske Fe-S protein